MTKRNTLLLAAALLIGGVMGNLQAQTQQNNGSPTPKDMFEVGAKAGHLFVSGDVSYKPGFGAGLHVRKSLDYVFSIRADGFFGKAFGEEGAVENSSYREYETTYMAGTVFGVISANSLRWNQSVRKFNTYAMVGLGGSYYEAASRQDPKRPLSNPGFSFSPHFAGGVGLDFRINNRINVGIEHQSMVLFGSKADFVDGFNLNRGGSNQRSLFRDIIHFTAVKVNVNIGSPTTHSEPLYWINPLQSVMDDLAQVKNQSMITLEDSDYDGVIDAIDQEPNTPPDVPVDTKGRTLDSDRDGVPDYKDREPYFPPRPGERVDAEGVVVNPVSSGPGGGVSEARVREIIAEEMQNYQLRDESSAGVAASSGGVAEWFLPMIHFGTSSQNIKYSDYGTLASIARMLKGNPNIRLVVTGYTDATGEVPSNNVLSYYRAKSVVDHLVNNHGIGRGRLVLEWKGQNDLLVPSGSSYMNRRVEFRVARPGDVEMDPPSGANQTSGNGY
ncbi:MAG: OmpA family protein [Phaeodactylibacter sp.]|nr:OmpA family protein [Phaeodactylibacter sp.]MCB9296648.1 OmpA family protein [Lewinellaceae bacterium]